MEIPRLHLWSSQFNPWCQTTPVVGNLEKSFKNPTEYTCHRDLWPCSKTFYVHTKLRQFCSQTHTYISMFRPNRWWKGSVQSQFCKRLQQVYYIGWFIIPYSELCFHQSSNLLNASNDKCKTDFMLHAQRLAHQMLSCRMTKIISGHQIVQLLPRLWYRSLQYAKLFQMRWISASWHQFTRVSLFENIIYAWVGVPYLQSTPTQGQMMHLHSLPIPRIMLARWNQA